MIANMGAIRMILVAAAVVLAAPAHAQGCSGGPDGGMDATGNQCSQATPVAAARMNPAPTTTATPRKAAAASQVARPASRERLSMAANRTTQPAKGPEPASVAPRAVKGGTNTGAN